MKKVIFILIVIVFGGVLFFNRDKTITERTFKVPELQTKSYYTVSVGKDYVIINDVKYYVNIDELIKNIDNAVENKTETVSSLVKKDNIYNKYDIFNQDGKTFIIFYKFEYDEDDRYDCPMFDVNDFEKVIRYIRMFKKDFE